MTHRIPASMLAVALAGTLGVAAPADAAPVRPLAWGQCADDVPGLPVDPAVQCATLTLPVDWAAPRGATFELAVARRPARTPATRVGALVFGPGGPGDSGVERVRRGNRFSAELLDRFDIVSFDPRGVARSAAPHCTPPDTVPPPTLLTSQADVDATVAYNRALWAGCRGPVVDHADTLSTVHDLDALRRALGETRLTFQGSSYGTLLGQQYAERFPGRVRAIMLDSVFDHSLDVASFVRTQAAALQDSFDEFVAWCDATPACELHGHDVRAVWADVLDHAALDTALLPIGYLNGPNWPGFAHAVAQLAAGIPQPSPIPPLPAAVFCADWSAQVHDYREYAALVRLATAAGPDIRYGAGLLAVRTCLGWPTPVRNPPHPPQVATRVPLLLLNAVHDPRTGYAWATHVAAQLGEHGRLLTYEGWGHGAYLRTDCTIAAVDRYLIDLVLPEPGARCAAPPVGRVA